MKKPTTATRRRLWRWRTVMAPILGLAVVAAAAAPASAAAHEKWQFQVVEKDGDLYKPVGTGKFKSDFDKGLWVGAASGRPAGATQAKPAGPGGLYQLEIGATLCGAQRMFTSIGAAQGVVLENLTGRPIEKIEFEIKVGETFAGVDAGDDGKIKVTNVGNTLTVEFKPPVQPGQFIWMRFLKFGAELGAKGKLTCGATAAPGGGGPGRCIENTNLVDVDRDDVAATRTPADLTPTTAEGDFEEEPADADDDLWFGTDGDASEPVCAVEIL